MGDVAASADIIEERTERLEWNRAGQSGREMHGGANEVPGEKGWPEEKETERRTELGEFGQSERARTEWTERG